MGVASGNQLCQVVTWRVQHLRRSSPPISYSRSSKVWHNGRLGLLLLQLLHLLAITTRRSITSAAAASVALWYMASLQVSDVWHLTGRSLSSIAENRCAHYLTRRQHRFVDVRHAMLCAVDHVSTAAMSGGSTTTHCCCQSNPARWIKTNKQ